MDIKVAYDNASWSANVNQHTCAGVLADILHLYKNFIYNRKVEITNSGAKKVSLLEKDYSQSSVFVLPALGLFWTAIATHLKNIGVSDIRTSCITVKQS